MSVTTKAVVILAAGAGWGILHADPKTADRVEKKDITVIAAQSSADGGSEVRREMVQDCIMSLPSPDKLDPQVTSEAMYLRGINGEEHHDAWTKVYTARLDVNYLNYQKELLIITTRSVQGQEPVIKDVEKKLRRTETFTSNPTQGDTYAGRSDRQYYFTSAEGAIKDVRERARVWIEQQAPVVCPEK